MDKGTNTTRARRTALRIINIGQSATLIDADRALDDVGRVWLIAELEHAENAAVAAVLEVSQLVLAILAELAPLTADEQMWALWYARRGLWLLAYTGRLPDELAQVLKCERQGAGPVH